MGIDTPSRPAVVTCVPSLTSILCGYLRKDHCWKQTIAILVTSTPSPQEVTFLRTACSAFYFRKVSYWV